MSAVARIFVALCIAAVLVGTGIVFAAAGAVYAGGWIVVHVEEKGANGSNVRLAFPGAAASLALALIPDRLLLPEGLPSGRSDEALRFAPVVEAALAGLEQCPDGVSLVEVDDGNEHVLISKTGGSLVVDVDGPDERVHVSIPLRMVSSVAGRVLRLAGRSCTRSV